MSSTRAATSRRRLLLTSALVAILPLSAPLRAQTLPVLPGGDTFTGTIHDQSGTDMQLSNGNRTLTVDLQNNNRVINWQSFSVGTPVSSTERVVFTDVGGVNHSVLNRVQGATFSEIYGSINADPDISVWLVNPNGIFFGSTGTFAGGALILSTADVVDFAGGLGTGSYALAGAPDGIGISIAAGATLNGANGVVAIAQSISNGGTIQAATGQVALIAARDVTLNYAPGGPLGITVTTGTRFGTASVDNSGNITAQSIKIVGASDADVVANLLNIASGTLTATDANGRIVISTQNVAAGTGLSTDTAAVSLAGAGGTDGLTIDANIVASGDYMAAVTGTDLLLSGTQSAAGNVSFSGPVTLDNNTLLSGTLVSFSSTVRAATDDVYSLGITGNASFGGAVGDNAQRLTSLSVSGTSAINGGSVTTTGSQTFTGAVSLGADTVLTSSASNGNIAMGQITGGANDLTVDSGAGAQSYNGLGGIGALVLTTTGTKTLSAGNYSWASVETTDGGVGNLGAVTTNGTLVLGQTTSFGAVTLGSNTTINGAPATFTTTVDGTTPGGQSLDIGNNATFAGRVGGATPLSGLSVTGTTALNAVLLAGQSSVMTTGSQSYTGAVTLGSAAVLTTTANGPVSLGTVTGGANDLTVNSGAGAQSFNGLQNIGTLTLSTSVAKTLNAGTYSWGALAGGTLGPVITNGVLTFGQATNFGTVNLGSNTTLNSIAANGALTLGAVTGNANNLTVTSGAGAQSFSGLANIGALTLTTSGTRTLNGGTYSWTSLTGGTLGAVTTNGTLVLGQPTTFGAVTLGSNTTINNAAVAFASTIDGTAPGAQSLSIGDNATFGGLIGNAVALSGLGVAGTTNFNAAGSAPNPSVRTTGNQSYTGAITLNGPTVLETTANGSVSLGPVSGLGNTFTVTTGAGPQSFNGIIGVDTLTLTTTGNKTLNTGTYFWNTLTGGTLGAVTTNGALTFGGPTTFGNVTLGSDTTIDNGPLNFTGTVNGATPGGQSLTINFNATFGGLVGNLAPLSSLSVTGTTAFNAAGSLATPSVTTTGTQSYAGAVTLGADTALATAGSAVTLAAVTGGGNDLAVSSGVGAQVFNGLADIGTLTLANSATRTLNAGTYSWNALTGGTLGPVVTNGVLTLGQATSFGTVTLGSATTLDSSAANGALTLGLVDGGSNSLTVSSGAGAQSFSGFANVNVLTLTTSASKTLNAGSYSWNTLTGGTLGAVVTNGTLALGQATTFGTTTLGSDTVLNGAPVAFTGAVNATTSGGQSLAVNDNASFAGAIGNIAPLSALTVTGTSAINGGAVTTTGSQNYGGAITLGADTALATTANGAVSLLGGVSAGGNDLSVSTGAGAQTFSGLADVGALTLSGTGPRTLNGGTYNWVTLIGSLGAVTTNGTLIFGQPAVFGAVTLGSATTIDSSAANGALTLGPVTGGGNDFTVSSGSGAQSFSGLANIGTLTLNGSATRTLNAGTYSWTALTGGTLGPVITNGALILGQATNFGTVTLGSATTLDSSAANGALTLGAVTGGGNNLTVTSGAGAQSFSGLANIGALTLTTSAVKTLNAGTYSWTSLAGGTLGPVITNGALTLGQATSFGTITLGSATTLDSSAANGALTLGAVTGGGNNLTVSSGAGAQSFSGLADIGALTLTTSAVKTLNAGTYSWASLTGGTLGAAVTNGALTFGQATTFGAVTLGSNTTLDSAAVNGALTLGPVTGAAHDLTVSAGSGDLSFSGLANIGTLTLATTGARTLNGGTYSWTSLTGGTLGAVTTNGVLTLGQPTVFGAIALGSNTTLDSSAANGALTLGQVSGATHDFTVSTGTGAQTYSGLADIGALTVSGTGLRTLNAGSYNWNSLIGTLGAVTTNGTLVFGQAATFGAVTLGSDTILAGAPMILTSTVNGTTAGAQSLTITGDATFGGAIGNTTVLSSLSVGGTSAISGGSVTTTGSQNYAGAVTLGASTTLSGTSASFGSTVRGATDNLYSLAVTGDASFGGAVGDNGQRLTALSVGGISAINGGSVTTSGNQNYAGAVTLGANTALTGALIGFGGTVRGAADNLYSLAITGNAIFPGAVGDNGQRLTALSVTGTSIINGGSVTTSGNQSYAGPATLGASTTFTGGLVSFGSTLRGATDNLYSLAIVGGASFGGAVGDNGQRFTSLSVSGGSAINGGSVTTSGSQSYSGAATLGANTTLTSTNGGDIGFSGTVDSSGAPASLTTTTTGTTLFAGNMGQTGALGSVAINQSGGTPSAVSILGSLAATGTYQVTGSTVTLGGAGAVQQTGGAIAINATGDVSEGAGGTTLRSTGGTLTVTSGTGAIDMGATAFSASGAASLQAVTAGKDISFASVTGATVDVHAGRGVTGTSVTATGGLARVTADAADIRLDSVTTTGGDAVLNAKVAMTGRAGGASTLSATANGTGSDILVNQTAGFGTGSVSLGTLRAGGDISAKAAVDASAASATAGGSITILAGHDASLGRGSAGAALLVEGGNNSAINNATAGTTLTVQANGVATVSSSLNGNEIRIVGNDFQIGAGATVTGTSIALVNRADVGTANGTEIGTVRNPVAGAFTVTQDELARLNAPNISIQTDQSATATQSVTVGALALSAGTSASRFAILTKAATGATDTARITLDGPISGDSYAGTLQIGGDTAGAVTTTSVLSSSITADISVATIALRSGAVDLRANRIAFGLPTLLADPTLATGDPQQIGDKLVSNSTSPLYFGGFAAGLGPTGVFLKASSLAVKYKDFALFQNTGTAGTSRGVELGPDAPSASGPIALSLDGSGQTANAFGLFGKINGFINSTAGLLPETVIVYSSGTGTGRTVLISQASSRLNGCVIGSPDKACLVTDVPPPSIRLFDERQAQIFNTAEDDRTVLDPLIGTNNEGLIGDIASPSLSYEDPNCIAGSGNESCPPQGDQK